VQVENNLKKKEMFKKSNREVVAGIYQFIIDNIELVKSRLVEMIPYGSIDYYENASYRFVIEDIYSRNFKYHHIKIQTGLYHVHLHIKDDDVMVKASSDSTIVAQVLVDLYRQEERNKKLNQLLC
jgi:hypothetical protein